ncbi:MAG TPA: xylulose kinase [Polyangiaceae bacterium]|nr:xylulose kinase [Polyangiaceae bacterium]
MSADLVVGVDSSTTACKVVVWDGQGQAVAEGRAGFPLENPAPDGWEQDARQWWRALSEASRAAVAGIAPERLGALCVTHQRETFVLTDALGEPVHPALVWMDARGADQVDRACAVLTAERLHRISGKPPCVTPSLYKLLGLLDREPALAESSPWMLDVHAYLVDKLTGERVTSLAAADPTGLVDMDERAWSLPILDLAGLSVEQLPQLVEPGTVIGEVTRKAAAATGLPAGLPVVAGAGDGQCAGLGAGITEPGRAYLNLGTAIVSGVLSETYRTDRAFRTLYDATGRHYFLETDLQGGTFTVTWLVDRWLRRGAESRSFDEVLAELDAEAATLPVGAEGLVVVPYWNGVMNPYWDDAATGVVLGLRGDHGPAHLFRAILEGIALEQRLHTTGVESASGSIGSFVAMGGGSKSPLWCQILADVLGRPVQRAGSSEATCLGAAILAAPVAGLHPDVDTATMAMTSLGTIFAPGEATPRYDRLYRDAYRGLFEDLRDRMHRLWRWRQG